MIIDQVLYPVETLGPGERIAIWIVGCNHQCKGCSNPELWKPKGQHPVSPKELFFAIAKVAEECQVDGITITGGEPFDQDEELLELVSYLQVITTDIIIFSGYCHEQLLTHQNAVAIMERIAVLVDGPYKEELNSGLPLRGSSNQRILLFDRDLKERYIEYLTTTKKKVQNFYFEDQTVSVGIHDVDFKENLDELLKKMRVRRATNGEDEMA